MLWNKSAEHWLDNGIDNLCTGIYSVYYHDNHLVELNNSLSLVRVLLVRERSLEMHQWIFQHDFLLVLKYPMIVILLSIANSNLLV